MTIRWPSTTPNAHLFACVHDRIGTIIHGFPTVCVCSQTGCVITGNLSDVVGRKPVVICCLLGTVVSHIMVARSTTLGGVAWGRIIGGITGGLTPIAQAAVADVVS